MTKLKVSSLQTIFATHSIKNTQIIQTHKLYKHTIIQTHNYTNTQLYKHTQLYLTIIILTNNPLVIQEGPDPGSV